MNFTHHNFDFLPWSLKIPSLFTEPWILTLEPYRKLSITNLISSLSPSLLNKMTTLCSLNSKTVPSTLTKFEEKNNFLHTQVLHSSLTWNLGKIPNYFNPKFSISHFTQLLTTKVTEHLQSNRSANRARKEPTHSAQTIQTRDNSKSKKETNHKHKKTCASRLVDKKKPCYFSCIFSATKQGFEHRMGDETTNLKNRRGGIFERTFYLRENLDGKCGSCYVWEVWIWWKEKGC